QLLSTIGAHIGNLYPACLPSHMVSHFPWHWLWQWPSPSPSISCIFAAITVRMSCYFGQMSQLLFIKASYPLIKETVQCINIRAIQGHICAYKQQVTSPLHLYNSK